jgi:hypothetical protein
MPRPSLSVDQIAFFEREGYIFLKAEEYGLVDLVELRKWADEVLHWPREKEKWMLYDEINNKGERQIMRTEKITDYHPQFRDLLCGDAVLALLRELTGKVMYALSMVRALTDSQLGAGRSTFQRQVKLQVARSEWICRSH